MFYKLLYLMLTTMLARFKYYHAWLFADAICNNSGFGFNGYDERGKARWDLVSNVDVFKFEVRYVYCLQCINKSILVIVNFKLAHKFFPLLCTWVMYEYRLTVILDRAFNDLVKFSEGNDLIIKFRIVRYYEILT